MMTTDTDRYNKVMNVINESLHLRWSEAYDSANGITEPEHRRRHYMWMSGIMTGLALAMEYPKTAVKIGQLVRKHEQAKELHLEFMADWLARYAGEAGWPVEQNPDLLRKLKADYQPEFVDSGARAVFSDDGVLTWTERHEGEYPLETFHATWEDWENVE